MLRHVFNAGVLFIALLGVWLMKACSGVDDTKPDNLLPEETMVNVLTDIHLAEARVGQMGLRSQDSSNIVYMRLEKQIFQKYKLDTARYNASYRYYSTHPREMEAVYKVITARLQKKLDQARKPTKS
ncbi:DUF4296 domain-containing protein [Spirosoma pomorum]